MIRNEMEFLEFDDVGNLLDVKCTGLKCCKPVFCKKTIFAKKSH
jgi:hypothetical protein